MSNFRISARVQFTPRSSGGQFAAAKITPGAIAGANNGAKILFDRSQELVAVDTGELKSSGHMVEAQERDGRASASVVYDSEHAGYVEWGTGIRGASSPGAGSVSYSPTWPGMAAQPYLRPSADSAREDIKSQFVTDLSVSIRTK